MSDPEIARSLLCAVCAFPLFAMSGYIYKMTQRMVDSPENRESIESLKKAQEELYHKLGQWG